ncbi:MAG TPA: (d)CMP kinase [Clostridiales bacterium]|nr:(d)CMP kinase [Clostridiales bacterium]
MLTIAIDGTSSSGKGIVCTKLAQKLGVVHFDTGAIYRALGVYVMDNNIDPYNEGEVEKSLKDITITLKHNNGEQITILNNIDVSNKIRLNKVSDICSIIAPYQKCREFVLNIQRNSAKKFDLIMEGRDITSHVLPNAKFRFFLDANIDVRAKRRYDELISKGQKVFMEDVKADLIERDRRDKERSLSPLILTKGTMYIDNSDMTIDEEVNLLYRIIKEK